MQNLLASLNEVESSNKLNLSLYSFTSQLHLLATPSSGGGGGGRNKVLVDDLSSPMFRHKLVQELFVQWNWQQVGSQLLI